MKSLPDTLDELGRDVSRIWGRACEEMIARVGATAETHMLIGEGTEAPEQPFYRAWLVPRGEALTPIRYPCVEMRLRDDDAAVTINVVDAPVLPTNGDPR